MFSAVVERLRAGESYYPAMGDALRRGDYPAASVFNWRMPALYMAMAAMPRWSPLLLMATLWILLLALFMIHLARHGSPEGTLIGLALSATAIGGLADHQGRWLTEAWSGVLIGVSLAAYLWRRWVPAALLGLVALFIRELAAPYCVACLTLAYRARRTPELRVWVGGLTLFGLYYALHASQIWGEVRPDDQAHARSWVQFGGLPFWLATIKANVALFAAPRVILAVASVLLVSALWDPSLPSHVRGSLVAYSVFFFVAGQRFNDYWGFVSVFVYSLALAHGPAGLWTLIRQTLPPRGAVARVMSQ